MIIYNIITTILLAFTCSAQESSLPWISSSPVSPTYVSLNPNINDFTRFADGGPDASWYIGFNNAWIVKLPAAPMGEYSKAYIGAKVGRAKTRPAPGKPWLREVIAGKIYLGISASPTFSAEQSYFLADTSDLPVEPDTPAHVDGAGASEWFWAEVPMTAVSFTGPNYIVVWSPTEYFVKPASSPVLAAANEEPLGPHEPAAWNNHSISGVPPRSAATALQTPINLSPALAIKLVPPGSSEVGVTDLTINAFGKKRYVGFTASGDNVGEAWVESSKDQLDWERISKIQRKPPYLFTIPAQRFPAPGGYLRGVARDNAGGVGKSEIYAVPFPAR